MIHIGSVRKYRFYLAGMIVFFELNNLSEERFKTITREPKQRYSIFPQIREQDQVHRFERTRSRSRWQNHSRHTPVNEWLRRLSMQYFSQMDILTFYSFV